MLPLQQCVRIKGGKCTPRLVPNVPFHAAAPVLHWHSSFPIGGDWQCCRQARQRAEDEWHKRTPDRSRKALRQIFVRQANTSPVDPDCSPYTSSMTLKLSACWHQSSSRRCIRKLRLVLHINKQMQAPSALAHTILVLCMLACHVGAGSKCLPTSRGSDLT